MVGVTKGMVKDAPIALDPVQHLLQFTRICLTVCTLWPKGEPNILPFGLAE
jgi:hypothetical protein